MSEFSPLVRDIPALIALIEERSATPFDWRGRNDCVSFAAAAVRAQCGLDPRGQLRWRSMRTALTVESAERGLEAAIDKRLARVAPALAMRGDIAGVPDGVLGIKVMVIEGAMLVGPGELGLERLPRSAMIMAWDAMSAATSMSDGDSVSQAANSEAS